MSTPNEGPGLQPWTPGNVYGAAQALSELNAREQQALGRVIRAAAAVGPIINGVARGIRVIRNTMTRLSERAVQLASAGRALGQTAVGNVRQTATNVGERTTNRASELSQQAGEAVGRARGTAANAGIRARSTVAGLARGTGAGLAAAGRGVANAGVAAYQGGRWALSTAAQKHDQVMDKVVDKVTDAQLRMGDMANRQISRGAAKASAAFAGLAARRADPTLTSPDQKLQKRDVLLAQKAAELFTSPDSERGAKAAELAAFIQNEYGGEQRVNLEKSGGPEQSVDAGARTTAATHEMAWVLKGNAPAAEIHSGDTPAAPDSASTGEQAPGRHTKKDGPTQSGQSIT
jgi:hypothetical protein